MWIVITGSRVKQIYNFLKLHFYTMEITFYAQNNRRSWIICCLFFWYNINFFYCLCFPFFFWFINGSDFNSHFVSNQISRSFCSFLNNSLEAVFAASIPVYSFSVFSVFWFCGISQCYNVYLIITVKLTLSPISSALLTWSINQTSTERNSVLTVFIIVKECVEIFINSPNCLFWTKINKTLIISCVMIIISD